MARLSNNTRFKLRVITVVGALWLAVVVAVLLWPEFPVGNCPDSPPDTAYVCRVGYNDDFDKAVTRRNLLVATEIGIVLAAAGILWLLQEPGESFLWGRPVHQKSAARPSPSLDETRGAK
jgi:hypothetical protein